MYVHVQMTNGPYLPLQIGQVTHCTEHSFSQYQVLSVCIHVMFNNWEGGRKGGREGGREHGFLSLPDFNMIKQQLLECSRKQWEAFLVNVAQTAIQGSHKIWVTRNWTDSQPPP